MLTIGFDPEVFSTYTKTKYDYVISPAMLEKLKFISPVIDDIKHPIYIKEDLFSWMGDGVAWELTTYKYFFEPEEIYLFLKESLNCLEKFLNKIPNIKLYKKPVVRIDKKLYEPYLEDIKVHMGFIFGCDEDFDPIITNYKAKEFNVENHKLRYGGGHIHFGDENSENLNYMHYNLIPFVQLLSIFVGNVNIAESIYPEEEKLRGFHYGKPGRYRHQSWGIEYRSPSNSWIENISAIEKIVRGGNLAFEYLKNPQE